MSEDSLRVVLDTNIYISALFGGNPEAVYREALRGRFTLLSSLAVLAELARKLREKFSFPEQEMQTYLKQIGEHAEIVRPRRRLSVLEDEADNRILECAVTGKADTIVSGDRHLLALHEYRDIAILRPTDFLRRLEDY